MQYSSLPCFSKTAFLQSQHLIVTSSQISSHCMCHTNCKVRLQLTDALVKDFSPGRRDPLGRLWMASLNCEYFFFFLPFLCSCLPFCQINTTRVRKASLITHKKVLSLHLINTAGTRQQGERKQLTFPACLSLYCTYCIISFNSEFNPEGKHKACCQKSLWNCIVNTLNAEHKFTPGKTPNTCDKWK